MWDRLGLSPTGTVSRSRRAVAFSAAALLSACTQLDLPTAASPEPPASRPLKLCDRPPPPSEEPGSEPAELPAAIQEVAEEVEGVRGLKYRTAVVPEPLTRDEIDLRLRESIDRSFPQEIMERRQRAWIAMGALPAATDLHQAVLDYAGSQFIGFYDTVTGEIVFIGSEDPSPLEELTLAHELTHALDDQHFGLERADALEARCEEEELSAYLALAEGSARTFEQRWAVANLGPAELLDAANEAAGSFTVPPASVPPFLADLLVFPYPNGQAFVSALLARGGVAQVNDAFRDPPVSTEQILHPDRYPGDEPRDLAVPDLSSKLGEGWTLIDEMDVGEGWLRLLFDLRLPSNQAVAGASGWDGGRYRAWANGSRTAVLLNTVWDGEGETEEFAETMETFSEGGAVSVLRAGDVVRVLFATDESALRALETAALL